MGLRQWIAMQIILQEGKVGYPTFCVDMQVISPS
jgi:hypothetical protein